jgi:hypothetical protein
VKDETNKLLCDLSAAQPVNGYHPFITDAQVRHAHDHDHDRSELIETTNAE